MAIFHAHGSFVSRSTGRSVVQCAAYIAKTQLTETRRDLVADYSKKDEVAFLITLAPEHAPAAMRDLTVWDQVESYEDVYALQRYRQPIHQEKYLNSAQTGQTLEVSLPLELNPKVWQELLVDFANERFVSRNLVVTIAIHNDSGNPHAHLLISRRAVTIDGEWSWRKDRMIVTKSALIETRRLWAEKTNFYLTREGLDLKIDHRSYAEQGIHLTPTRHEGWYAHKLESLGQSSRIVEENNQIRALNKEVVTLDPEVVLTELTNKKSTFCGEELARAIQYRVGDDCVLGKQVYETSLEKSTVVGNDLYDRLRYTTTTHAELETKSLELVNTMLQTNVNITIRQTEVSKLLKPNLSNEQQQAVFTLCKARQLTVLVGYAGTGKTTTLKCVVAAHKTAGAEVVGMALSANAADNLGQEINAPAETIAFYLDKWERLAQAQQKFWSFHLRQEHQAIVHELQQVQQYGLTAKHVVLVDEAAMVGSEQWNCILKHVHQAQAKLIIVGDPQQFKAIAAGDFVRKVIEVATNADRCVELTQVVRQKNPLEREASIELAKLNTHSALAFYENQGCVKKIDLKNDLPLIAESYCLRRTQMPETTGLLLAYTREHCQQLNLAVRKQFQRMGVVEQKEVLCNGQPFAVGDEIVFLANDRKGTIKTEQNFMVKNGTCGKIVAIDSVVLLPTKLAAIVFDAKPRTQQQFTVAIGNITAKFTTDEYQQFTHGYALTLHKAQGKTVDWSMVVANKYMDAHATYVALTRHRTDVTLYYDTQTFPTFKSLQQGLARVATKDLVVDYSISDAQQPYWEQMQEYLLLGRDLQVTAQNKNWATFNELKKDRQELAKTIIANWDQYQHFARQAGLSLESLAIAAKLKARPLSLAEQQAKNSADTYINTSIQARQLWQEIRRELPGANCHLHKKYNEFTQLRQERNQLAGTISANYGLHKEFLKNQPFFVSLKMLQAQQQQGVNFSGEVPVAAKSMGLTVAQKTQEFEFRSPEQIKQALNYRICDLAEKFLGTPTHKTAREWRYGSKGSISIIVSGSKQGAYANFEKGSYGGACKLIEDHLSMAPKDAFKYACAWLNLSAPTITRSFTPKTAPVKETWKQIAVPANAPRPNLTLKPLSYQLTKYDRTETGRFAYRNEHGELLGYTVRLEDNKGTKVVLPLTYRENSLGQQAWRWQGFGGQRPLYGLERLAASPEKTILIVEGEKTANAAQKLLPEYTVMTWPGGAGATNLVNWQPLVGKTVLLWPDHDPAGSTAMHKIQQHIKAASQEAQLSCAVNIVPLPKELPEKWDLADPLPSGFTIDTVKELLISVEPKIKLTHYVGEKKVLTKDQIVPKLMNYGMSWLYSANEPLVNWQINQFYNTALTQQKDSPELMTKMMLAGSLPQFIYDQFFDKRDPQEVRADIINISLIAAELKFTRTDRSRMDEFLLIVNARKVYEEQQQKFANNIAQTVDTTPELQKILVQEQCRHFNYTGKELTTEELNLTLKNVNMISQEIAQQTERDPKQDFGKAIKCPGFYSEILQTMRQPDSVDLLKTIKETTKRIAEQEAQIIKAQEMQVMLQQQKVKELEIEKSL